jgi:hypothetical protein
LKRIFIFWIFIVAFLTGVAQSIDTTIVKMDTIPVTVLQQYSKDVTSILSKSYFLNSSAQPVSIKMVERKSSMQTEGLFYLLAFLVLFLAFLKFFYERYFNNLFRVFFNTTLKQSQLTDQLLQSKLPSLLFNLFFVFSSGVYLYFLLRFFKLIPEQDSSRIIGLAIGGILLVYLTKFLSLKFIGWLVGYKEVTNTYIFIVFLINKILGIFLLPFTLIIAFGSNFLQQPTVIISIIIVGLFLLLRFVRSYSNLQNKIKVSRFHFFLYLVGVEIVPLLLIYKSLMILLSKNG